ncbi:DUF6896 domain-containing protein [Xanthomonas sacchari]|uniref:DUF6896 domain-containing protein n=1 Tax=Xanthomonas sacchari TaxID=56458 RepID=UPI0035272613
MPILRNTGFSAELNYLLFLLWKNKGGSSVEKKLDRLIRDYQKNVHEALVLMHRSGIHMPASRAAWIKSNIPHAGLLDGGVPYFKHGAGCAVHMPNGKVDFDFGVGGEIDEFDAWRLFKFAKENLSEYGFDNKNDLEVCFEEAVSEGFLVRSAYCLFYLRGRARVLAVDIDSRLLGDKLPPRNMDDVLVLNNDYFEVADLMLLNYNNLRRKWERDGRLSNDKSIDMRIYLRSWLGFLAVTCEGFETIGMRRLLREDRPVAFVGLTPRSDAVGSLIKKNRDPLRELRNKTFHLRKDAGAIRTFFAPDANRISWARELHKALKEFFTKYRLECELHYVLNGRRGEVCLKRPPPKKW